VGAAAWARRGAGDPRPVGRSPQVETGSLYPALHRLEKRGWLKSAWGTSEANHKAKYYQLTPAGRAQLSREHDRWSQLVNAIGRIMNPSAAENE
jgi:PadR family transcriptional regulator PadR